ncbi:PREDICTED: uncharacterized protein LOC105363020 [Ceratosolen solmsi marchali]|uniref:Uncharacterized protein LOC105363020 n=1 Tax=Ceratosolen solmsi marchali TaxID=326594 RepID=A0AAJ6YIV4_9HYME|nr:PREDICTED: uncharacterized protein LOC105363020 [Ceratosolen solmsi marchali]
MSCIKFPSSRNDLSKMSSKEYANDHGALYSQLIQIANEMFGLDNWSHAITNQTLDFIDYNTGKYQVGCASIVRVQRRDGTFHEGIGYCNIEGSSKGSAIQKSRMISLNDAFKKALNCFGTEIKIKISRLSNGSSCSLPTKNTQNESPHNKANNLTDTDNIEPFKETVQISQTDAMMDMVDLDQLYNKDKKSDAIIVYSKNVKIDTLKPSTDGAPKNTDINNVNKVETEAVIGLSEILFNTYIIIIPVDAQFINNNKLNIANDVKKETKDEVPKTNGSTAISDEEMRLERKRKQRELQEEFKRKEELKKKLKNTHKQPSNPRY